MINHKDFSTPVSELIHKRYSCRTYKEQALSPSDITQLQAFSDKCQTGRFGSDLRFKIAAASEEDSTSLKNLGTYGFIKNPTGFVIGAITDQPLSLEDIGYQMELIILRATDLGIGTCWLGGTFTKSRFTQVMDLTKSETIPCVVSLGYPADQKGWMDRASRIYAGADRRHPWQDLFFSDSFAQSLSPAQASQYKNILENVRLAPSASNRQPWRILKQGQDLHFYLKRTKKYPPPFFDFLLGLADLQRIDMGIAMAHFELSAREAGLKGTWTRSEPELNLENPELEFIATWTSEP